MRRHRYTSTYVSVSALLNAHGRDVSYSRLTASDLPLYRVPVANAEDETFGQRFAKAIRDGRRAKRWTQDDLIDESGVSRATILRWEAGDVARPEPDKVRAVFKALGLDLKEAPVLLGYVTREEMGLPPEPPRVFDASVEEALAILLDPTVPEAQKQDWLEYLRYRTGRPAPDQRPKRNAS